MLGLEGMTTFFGGTGPTIGLFLGLLFTLFFGIFPLFFGKRKNITYLCTGKNLISDISMLNSKFTANFDSKLVKHLTLTDCYIWNSGNETIDDIDLITENPLRLTNLGRGIMLDIQKSVSTNPANGSSVVISNDQRDILINFKYLDPKDALIISVLHGGEYPSSIEIVGSIRGIRKIGQFSLSMWKFLPFFLIIIAVGFSIVISSPQPTQIIEDAKKAISLAESKEILGLYKPQNSLSYLVKLLIVFLSFYALTFYIYLSSKRNKILNLQSKLSLFENLKIFIKDFF
jgi:hypothetical protein